VTEQPSLFGETVAVGEDKLGPNQRAVLAAIRERGRLSKDEAGALLHERRGKHSAELRCEWCATDGADVLASLRRRGFENGDMASEASYDPATAEIPF
jgi:hypothetical protein